MVYAKEVERIEIRKKFSSKRPRRVAPIRTGSASSCGLTSEVTSQEIENVNEKFTKSGSRIGEYWNKKLKELKESLSTYVSRRANDERDRGCFYQ
ncbi:hypothetical protein SNEBB_005450 [Seison nebaliae]|nr:hypothetical protein SNEBB_005450 [Seison nebaliae]